MSEEERVDQVVCVVLVFGVIGPLGGRILLCQLGSFKRNFNSDATDSPLGVHRKMVEVNFHKHARGNNRHAKLSWQGWGVESFLDLQGIA